MANKYLDLTGLGTVVDHIHSLVTRSYKVRGSAIYADTDYLASSGKEPSITSGGLWQLVSGVWTKLTLFDVGWVYNIQNDFTTDANFIEGSGTLVKAGTNIVVAESGTSPVIYKFDLLGTSRIDLTAYQTKAITDNISTTLIGSIPFVYADSNTPVSPAEGDIRIYTSGNNIGQAEIYSGSSWLGCGSCTSVESVLQLLSNVIATYGTRLQAGIAACADTPITTSEINALFS